MDIFIYSSIVEILMLLWALSPLYIYLMNRSPKINYNTEYEVDMPTDDPPAIVNAVCAGDPKRVGVPNLDGFRATILDLISRNYLFLKNESYNGSHYHESLLLEINPNNDISSLWKFEVQVLDFLKESEQDGIISLDLISKNLDPSYSYSAYGIWRNEVRSTLLDGNNFKDAFHSRGYIYLKIFGVLGTIIAWALIFYSFPSKLFSGTFISCALILWISSIISLFLTKRIAGQWTAYGREYYKRWMNFRSYIEDFSLIKEYPPESVKIWDKYLAYATALGAAKGVRRAMEISLSDDQLEESDVYMFHMSNYYRYFKEHNKRILELD